MPPCCSRATTGEIPQLPPLDAHIWEAPLRGVVDDAVKCEYLLRRTPERLPIRGSGSVGEIGTPRNRASPLGIVPIAASRGRFHCGSEAGVRHLARDDLTYRPPSSRNCANLRSLAAHFVFNLRWASAFGCS